MEFEASPDLPEVVCVILDNGSEILVEERIEENELFGHITFLGGRVDPVDRIVRVPAKAKFHLNQASSREIEEEAGIVLAPDLFHVFTGFETTSLTGYHATFWGTAARYLDRNHDEHKEKDKRKLHWLSYSEVEKRVKGNPVDEIIWRDYVQSNLQTELHNEVG